MLSYYAFKVPFKVPFRISNLTIHSRNGVYIVYDNGDFIAYGEIAPLPGFSKESIDQVVSVLIENQKNLEHAILKNEAEQLIAILDSIHNFPSLSFGLDALLLDLNSKKNSTSLHKNVGITHHNSVKVNGTIGIQNVKSSISKAHSLINEGVDTLKLKVGVDHAKELEIIAALRDHYSTIKIRIDANQAWDPKMAIQCLKDFEKYKIEYCEQPVCKFDINGLKKVKNEVAIPIAADESVRSFHHAKELVKANACDIIILKPSLFGRIKNCLIAKKLCDSNKMDIVITTAFDTIVGRTITALLASNLGSNKYAHGLATGPFLNESIDFPQEICDGTYLLPSKSGISFDVDLSQFKKIS